MQRNRELWLTAGSEKEKGSQYNQFKKVQDVGFGRQMPQNSFKNLIKELKWNNSKKLNTNMSPTENLSREIKTVHNNRNSTSEKYNWKMLMGSTTDWRWQMNLNIQ